MNPADFLLVLWEDAFPYGNWKACIGFIVHFGEALDAVGRAGSPSDRAHGRNEILICGAASSPLDLAAFRMGV